MSDSGAFTKYLANLDLLGQSRERVNAIEKRAKAARAAEEAREDEINEELDACWERLTLVERGAVGKESWRAWPHKRAERGVLPADHLDDNLRVVLLDALLANFREKRAWLDARRRQASENRDSATLITVVAQLALLDALIDELDIGSGS